MPDSGADLLSIDRVELPEVARRAGGRCRIIGNFDTSAMLLSPADSIGSSVAEMVLQGRSCPRGFVAATGCEVPVDTPPENVHAFVQAVREAGRNQHYGGTHGHCRD